LIIDVHAHPIFRDVHPPGMEELPPRDYVLTARRYLRRDLELITLSEYLERKRRAGVDRVVVFLRDDETISGVPPANDWVSDLAERHRDHFIPFYALDPNKGAIAARTLREAHREGRAMGVKIHPYAAGIPPNSRRAYPLYKAAEELGVPVLFHSGPGPVGTRMEYCRPIYLDDVALDFPDLRIVIAHFSGPWYMEAYALAWRHENVYVDISFHPEAFIRSLPWRLFEETIPDKILFGTDFPFNMPDERVEMVKRLPISNGAKRMILGENAARLLGL